MKSKFMILVVISLAVISMILLFPSNDQNDTSIETTQESNLLSINEEEEEKQNPKFYEEWLEMKKNDEGIIPTGLVSKWYEHDLRMERENPNTSSRTNTVTYLGPEGVGGRTRAILVDQANNSRYFAGGVSGGLWVSNNSGSSWSPINDMAATLSVTCITQNPFNANEIYYGTGETFGNSAVLNGSGVFKSTNGGASFQLLPSTQSNSNFSRCNDIEYSKSQNGRIYVATNRGLYLSSNSGGSWNLLTNNIPIYDILSFAQGGVLIATREGLMYSADGISNFNQITNSNFPVFPNFYRIQLANCQDVPNTVYVVFAEENVNAFFKSTDGGQTWEQKTTPAIDAQNGYNLAIGVHKSDPDKIAVGGVRLRYSMDGGQSWTGIVTPGHADNHTFVVIPNAPNEMLVGNDGGVYKKNWLSPYSGATDLNSGYDVTQFYRGDYAATGLQAIGGTQDNSVYTLDINGNDSQIKFKDGFSCYFGKINPDLLYYSFQKGELERRVIDGIGPGNNLVENVSLSSLTGEPVAFATNFEVNSYNENELYTNTNDGLWRLNWTGNTNNPYNLQRFNTGDINGTIRRVALEDKANPTIFYSGSLGNIHRIDNAATAGGNSNVDLTGTIPSSIDNDHIGAIAIEPGNTDVIYVGFTDYEDRSRLYRVTNALTNDPDNSPTNWTAIGENLPDLLPVNSIAIDPMYPCEIIYVGTDYGLYYTLNGGSTWQKENSIPNAPIFDLRMRSSDRHLFVFSHGRGAWTIDVDDVPTTSTVNITGNIQNENGSNVGLVSNNLCSSVTGSNGSYSCSNQAIGQAYTITPVKDVNYINGVTAFDLVKVRQHILGTNLLDSPYKIIAADVNQSSTVTGFDMVQIKQLILNIISEFPSSDSWRFIPKDFDFLDPLDPLDEEFPESISIASLTACNGGSNDFIGLKVGDVNLSANANNFTDDEVSDRARTGLSLSIVDQKINAGALIEIPVTAEGMIEKIAYQFKMNIDSEYFEVLDWKAGDLSSFDKENFSCESNELRTLWFNNESDLGAVTLSEKSTLFTLTLKAKKGMTSLAKAISFDAADTFNAIYDEAGKAETITLDFNNESDPTEIDLEEVTAFKIFPNPFKDEISITYPDSFIDGRVELINADGKLIKQIDPSQSSLDLASLSAGIYYLRFTSKEKSTIEKIVKK